LRVVSSTNAKPQQAAPELWLLGKDSRFEVPTLRKWDI